MKKIYKKLKNNFEEGLEKLLNTKISNKFCIDQYWKKLQRVDNWKIIYPPLLIQKKVIVILKIKLLITKNCII